MKKYLIAGILWYVRVCAQIELRKVHPRIIGVAGSSGKTSLVQLLGAVIGSRYRISKTSGQNSEIGLPLHILGVHIQKNSFLEWLRILCSLPLRLIRPTVPYDVLIAEMGIDSPVEPKNMSYLLKIIRPTIGMVTNVSLEHSMYFDPYITQATDAKKQSELLALTAEQELLLLHSLPQDGYGLVNLDDPESKKSIPSLSARLLTLSLHDANADLFAKKITTSLSSFTMDIVWKRKTYSLMLPQALPTFFAYEFLFTLGTALLLDITPQEAIEALQKYFALPAGRLSFFKGIKGTTLIDSTYNNATLEPVMGILDMLQHIHRKRRRVVIMGDMRELGSQSKRYHELLAKKIAKTSDTAILIGPLLTNYAVPLLRRVTFPFQSFLTFTEAKEAILSLIEQGDIILVKGSQNTLFLERVVELLLADKKDVAYLCRRGEFWDKKRSETP